MQAPFYINCDLLANRGDLTMFDQAYALDGSQQFLGGFHWLILVVHPYHASFVGV